MRILVLGGTAWLGRTVVEHALRSGHDVTCAARRTAVPDGARSVHVDRARDDALDELAADGRWDAVIDVARTPEHVRRSVRDLESVADRYVFVSSVSVYASHADPGADESAALLAPSDDPAAYGSAKAACERAVLDAFGPHRSSIARVGLIGGPGDHTGRSGYWPWRFGRADALGRAVVVPAADEQTTSVIDVRDLAAWLVRAAGGSCGGVFDVAGEPTSFDEHLAVAKAAAHSGAPTVVLPDEQLLAHGVAPWAGPHSLPLWIPDVGHRGMNARTSAAALAAGLQRRPLAATLADVLRWEREQPEQPHGAGLTDAEEDELLRVA